MTGRLLEPSRPVRARPPRRREPRRVTASPPPAVANSVIRGGGRADCEIAATADDPLVRTDRHAHRAARMPVAQTGVMIGVQQRPGHVGERIELVPAETVRLHHDSRGTAMIVIRRERPAGERRRQHVIGPLPGRPRPDHLGSHRASRRRDPRQLRFTNDPHGSAHDALPLERLFDPRSGYQRSETPRLLVTVGRQGRAAAIISRAIGFAQTEPSVGRSGPAHA